MLIERTGKEVWYLTIIPREVDRDDDQKKKWRNCVQADISRRNIKNWKRRLKADLTERSPSRRRRSALDCSAI